MEPLIGPIIFIFAGALHVVLLVFLKHTGKLPGLYLILEIKKSLIATAVLLGLIVGIFTANNPSVDFDIHPIVITLGITLGVTLFVIGVGFVWGIPKIFIWLANRK